MTTHCFVSALRLATALAVLVASASTELAGAEESLLPTGTVSLADAVAATLLHSPDLAVYSYELRARDARVLQEGLFPNPTLAVEVENFARFGGDGRDVETTQTTVSLSQVLELAGKRRRRVAVAELELRLADRDYERARRDAAAKTAKAFVSGLLAQARLALAERLVRNADAARTAARRQLEGGVGSPADVSRAAATLAEAEATRGRRQREVHAAAIALAGNWGGATSAVTRLAGSLEPVVTPPALAALRSELAATPELTRAQTAIDRAAAGLALEEARRVPDVTLRVGARRFVSAETNALVAEVSVPLPLFDRNQGAVAEASAQLAKARAARAAVAVGIETLVATTYEELRAAAAEATDVRDAVLPRSRAALDEIRRGHQAGVLRYLDVLSAERTVAEHESTYLDALARYRLTTIELERLLGVATTAAQEAAR